jgi:hypothetical protein
MQQRRLIDARRIVQKLVVSAAMTENPAIGPRTISVPRRWVAGRRVLWCGAYGGLLRGCWGRGEHWKAAQGMSARSGCSKTMAYSQRWTFCPLFPGFAGLAAR